MIAWVPEDGSRIDLITLEGISIDTHGFMEGFTVSPNGQDAYFLEQSSGTIFKFDWPV